MLVLTKLCDNAAAAEFQVQGMSFIAAVLLLNMDDVDTFICFANLLNKPCAVAFFRLDENLVRFHTHLKLLKYRTVATLPLADLLWTPFSCKSNFFNHVDRISYFLLVLISYLLIIVYTYMYMFLCLFFFILQIFIISVQLIYLVAGTCGSTVIERKKNAELRELL